MLRPQTVLLWIMFGQKLKGFPCHGSTPFTCFSIFALLFTVSPSVQNTFLLVVEWGTPRYSCYRVAMITIGEEVLLSARYETSVENLRNFYTV
jgi:hypothetical protein